MKIAIFSDSHDQIANLDRALQHANAAGAGMILHCGDLCAPFMLARMAAAFGGHIHVVFGNNDGDGRLLQTIAGANPNIHLHGIYTEISVAGRQIAMIHYPEPARRIAESGHFDLVCYGHDHTRTLRNESGWILVNPGELLGMKSSPSWALYDAVTGVCSLMDL